MTFLPGQLLLPPAASIPTKHGTPTALYNDGRLSLSHVSIYNQRYKNTYPVWSSEPQYRCGYEQHTIAPPDNNFMQIPVLLQDQTPWTGQVFVDGQNRSVTTPPGQFPMHFNGTDMGHGQRGLATVELNMDGLLEHQEQRQRAVDEGKDPLTPAQRRRKAQNRTAQRALRNRKRQRVQELEAQFSASELRINSLESENKRLKHELLLTQDENRNLRKVTRAQASSNALRSTSWR